MNSRPLDHRWAVAAIGLLIVLVMLPNLVWLAHDPAGPVWVAAVVLPIAMLAIWFAALGRWPWIACLLLTPLALLAPLETYYVALYHHPTSAQIIATIVATNLLEAREYFGRSLLPLALLLPAGALVALATVWASRRAGLRWRG
jgi:glucan phosphoethanolaminetransferase (alkaline phosphatase superfamily)